MNMGTIDKKEAALTEGLRQKKAALTEGLRQKI